MRARWLIPTLALLAAETAVAVWLIRVSEHVETKWAAFAFAVPVGISFALAGLVALIRRPENRTGWYLAATGYLWFIAALHTGNSDWAFTVAVALGNAAFVPFALLVLSFPAGHLETAWQRRYLVGLVAGLVAVPTAALLADRTLERSCTGGCRESVIAVADAQGLSDVIMVIDTVVGIALILGAAVLIAARWRRATTATRRALGPVLLASGAALAALLVVNLTGTVSSRLSDALSPLFLIAFTAIPLAFLAGLLRTRLERSSVAGLVVALGEGLPLRDVLARTLRDPSLEVAFRRSDGSWIGSDGAPVPPPAPDGSPAGHVTPVLVNGEEIAAIVHDRSLSEEPELVSAVTAAAGLAFRNERLQAELRSQHRVLTTIIDTAPSLLVQIDTAGRIVEVNPAAVAASGHLDTAAVSGRPFWEVFIDAVERDAMVERFRAAAPDFAPATYENAFTNARGERIVIAWESAPLRDETGLVTGIVAGGLDITERKRNELALERERDLRRQREEEVRASRTRIVQAADEARRRLERNLHDGAQQRLVSLSVALRIAQSRIGSDPGEASRVLTAAGEELTEALAELRELARGIHPAVLTDRGLRPALDALVARSPVPVELSMDDGELPAAVEAAVYYVVAEALTNVAKYSGSPRAQVCITSTNGTVTVEVRDAGAGGADPEQGSGLRGLQDRLAALDGTLEVTSIPGEGTVVSAVIPVARAVTARADVEAPAPV
ncbi:MAG: PAS domain S-box protein [Gaiella sp.]